MEALVQPQNTIAVLKKHGFHTQKKYGQNFLIDPRVLEKIVDAAELSEADFALEIGPGIGTLTQALAERAGKVVAVEIDRTLLPVLSETLSDYPNVEVINGDILKLDLADLLETRREENQPLKIIANLPYYITTPILMRFLEENVPYQSITVMVQREVAERMKAVPGTKDYGALSLAIQYHAVPEIVAHVPPNCFLPRPDVASAVIRLTRQETPPVAVKDEKLLFTVIRAAFAQRRKTLTNALSNAAALSLSKEDTAACLKKADLPDAIRGEALDLAAFARLSDIIYETEHTNRND